MISVIVCTHNPRKGYLSRTLGSLREQTLPHDRWDLVIVDNASDERLESILDLSWHSAARIIREDDLGLTPARLRGIRESASDVLVFVDDDNVLAPDYLANVERIERVHPAIGAWSGSISPEFESPPPEWTRRYWGNLVIREVNEDRWSSEYFEAHTTPLGAGLCVRREVALEYLRLHDEGFRRMKMDRAGQSLVSGGDNDLAACALDLGLTCGVMSSLKLTHLIPDERLTENYLLRLIESIAYSSVILRSFRAETSNGGPPARGGVALDIVRRARMTPRERRFHSAVKRGEVRARKELEAS